MRESSLGLRLTRDDVFWFSQRLFRCDLGSIPDVWQSASCSNRARGPATASNGQGRCPDRTMRIALIQALKHSIEPIRNSFARLWPEARLMNLLDDSLSSDLARSGGLTDVMTERFLTLGRNLAWTGTDGILFTCSAFGHYLEAVANENAAVPVFEAE
jgi:hypothetical protein